ncbi:MAG: hypothetical protein AB7S39_21840, partial [Gemmatimonadales bacterium]
VPWARPAGSVFSLTEAELDSLPEFIRPPAAPIRYGNVVISFDGVQYLDRKDLATIFLIRDNLGKRPIYFSWSAGGFPDQTLGLTPYLVTQGFVRKLYSEPVRPGNGIIMSAGMGWMDLARTKALLWDVYRWQDVARSRPAGWVDEPSQSILELYGVVYAGTAATLRTLGDAADSTMSVRADSVAQAVVASLRPRR